jgi:hypothetical protein
MKLPLRTLLSGSLLSLGLLACEAPPPVDQEALQADKEHAAKQDAWRAHVAAFERRWTAWHGDADVGSSERAPQRRLGELLVRHGAGVAPSSAEQERSLALESRLGLKRVKTPLPQTALVQFDEEAADFADLKAELEQQQGVRVEPNLRFTLAESSPFASELRASPRQVASSWSRRLRSLELHWTKWPLKPAADARRIRIGIMDTGVDFTHPDLKAVMGEGVNCLRDSGDGVFLDPGEEARDASAMDYHGHGTMVAGVIGATTRDEATAGLLAQVSLHPIKVMNGQGIGTLAAVLEGIRWAIDHDMHILNVSLGTYAKSPLLAEALAEARAKGIVVVASAGNDHIDALTYPARLDGVISVGSHHRDGTLSSFSNWSEEVDVFGPGEEIASTHTGKRGKALYRVFSGTSAAAPFVSALAGLLLQRGVRPADVESRVRQSALPMRSDRNPNDGRFSVANLDRAVATLTGEPLAASALTFVSAEQDDAPDYQGNLVVSFEVTNAGTVRSEPDALSMKVEHAQDELTVPLANVPSLAVGQSHSGRVAIPVSQLLRPGAELPADSVHVRLTFQTRSRLLQAPPVLERSLVAAPTGRIDVLALWSEPPLGQETASGRTLFARIRNTGNGAVAGVTVQPSFWDGVHEAVGPGKQTFVSKPVAVGTLAAGEVRTLAFDGAALETLPPAVTFQLDLDGEGKNAARYLKSHERSEVGVFQPAYSQEVHRRIATYASDLLKLQGVYIPDLHHDESRYLGVGGSWKDWGLNPQVEGAPYTLDDHTLDNRLPLTGASLIHGAHDCDGWDIIYGNYRATTWDSHFWIVDTNDRTGLGVHSAYEKVGRLLNGGGNLTVGALDSYRRGMKRGAWYLLGHAVHLIGDMSLGSHVNETNQHGVPGVGDAYHGYVDHGGWGGITPATVLRDQGGFVDPYQSASLGDPVRFLSYTTAQVGNSFPWNCTECGVYNGYLGKEGNRVAGGDHPHYDDYMSGIFATMPARPVSKTDIRKDEVLDRLCPWSWCRTECQWVDVIGPTETPMDCSGDRHADRDNTDLWGNGMPRDDDGDLWSITRYAFPYSVRAAAGLVYHFAVQTGQIKHSLNNDRKVDLMFFNPTDNTMHVRTSTGSSFTGGGQWIPPNGFGSQRNNYYPGDFNGDGIIDLGYMESDSAFYVSVGTKTGFGGPGSGQWFGPGAYGTLEGGRYFVGDFTGDGADDLYYFENGSNQHYVNVSSRSGFWAPGSNIWSASNSFGWTRDRFYPGDFNGDGKVDMAFFETGNNSMYVALSSGSSLGPAQQWTWGSFGNANGRFLTGDFNGDGKDDLHFFNNGDKSHSVSISTGGTFEGAGSGRWIGFYGWGTYQDNYYVGDFNGDGKADLGYHENLAFYVNPSTGSGFNGPGVGRWLSPNNFSNTTGRFYVSNSRRY